MRLIDAARVLNVADEANYVQETGVRQLEVVEVQHAGEH